MLAGDGINISGFYGRFGSIFFIKLHIKDDKQNQAFIGELQKKENIEFVSTRQSYKNFKVCQLGHDGEVIFMQSRRKCIIILLMQNKKLLQRFNFTDDT